MWTMSIILICAIFTRDYTIVTLIYVLLIKITNFCISHNIIIKLSAIGVSPKISFTPLEVCSVRYIYYTQMKNNNQVTGVVGWSSEVPVPFDLIMRMRPLRPHLFSCLLTSAYLTNTSGVDTGRRSFTHRQLVCPIVTACIIQFHLLWLAFTGRHGVTHFAPPGTRPSTGAIENGRCYDSNCTPCVPSFPFKQPTAFPWPLYTQSERQGSGPSPMF